MGLTSNLLACFHHAIVFGDRFIQIIIEVGPSTYASRGRGDGGGGRGEGEGGGGRGRGEGEGGGGGGGEGGQVSFTFPLRIICKIKRRGGPLHSM